MDRMSDSNVVPSAISGNSKATDSDPPVALISKVTGPVTFSLLELLPASTAVEGGSSVVVLARRQPICPMTLMITTLEIKRLEIRLAEVVNVLRFIWFNPLARKPPELVVS
jgi:hypothetical protein